MAPVPMKVLGVIPARYGAARFPGKPLAPINGEPLIHHVWRRAGLSKRLDALLIATDDRRILEAAKRFGAQAVMTPLELPSGTDRVWEAAKETPAQIIVNIQGDEPLLIPGMVDSLVEAMLREPALQMSTLRFPMRGKEGYLQSNIVKVVTDDEGWALYFSRSPIPAVKEGNSVPPVWYKHIGLYAYRREFLKQFVSWPPSALEISEGLEQLRALSRGIRIRVLDSPADTVGVDTPQDLERVRERMRLNA